MVPLAPSAAIVSAWALAIAVSGLVAGYAAKSLVIAERGGSDARDRAVGVAQHELRDVGHRQPAHRALEIHCPQCRAGSRGRSVADDECRVCQVELEIERIARAGAYRERRVEVDVYRHREVAGIALPALDLDVARRDTRAARQREARLRVARHREQHVAGIRAEGENRSGVVSGRHTDVAEDLAELIELLEVHIRGRGIPHGYGVAAAGRHERDAEHAHTDAGPVVR